MTFLLARDSIHISWSQTNAVRLTREEVSQITKKSVPDRPTRIRPAVAVTSDRIALAALAILDAATHESELTVRAIAASLGVKAPSLYAHVSGIDEVIDIIHQHINATIDLTILEDSEDLDDLRAFIISYRNAYRAHRVAASVITRRDINSDHALAVYEAVAAFFLRIGVPDNQVMPLMALLDNLVLGSAVEPFASSFHKPPRSYKAKYPAISTSLDASKHKKIDDLGFALGVDAFLELVSDQ